MIKKVEWDEVEESTHDTFLLPGNSWRHIFPLRSVLWSLVLGSVSCPIRQACPRNQKKLITTRISFFYYLHTIKMYWHPNPRLSTLTSLQLVWPLRSVLKEMGEGVEVVDDRHLQGWKRFRSTPWPFPSIHYAQSDVKQRKKVLKIQLDIWNLSSPGYLWE